MTERPLQGIIGSSAVIGDLRRSIQEVAALHLPVLVEGPTGAGKELVARALHELSGRSGRFVAVNVCALADSMFEATLFGHVRGAFTGAVRDLPGYLMEANGGTLFLDEIGGLPAAHQAKLLRAIETGDFRPIGGNTDRHSDFRLVSATNEPIDSLVGTGQFRPDLQHRLTAFVLRVPSLQDRREDIPGLVHHFAQEVPNAPASVRFTRQALSILTRYRWPGNVRELRHVITGAVALSAAGTIRRSDVLRMLSRRSTNGNGNGHSLKLADRRRELTELLDRCDWDTARVAAQLGVARSTIYRRMERLAINPTRRVHAAAGYLK